MAATFTLNLTIIGVGQVDVSSGYGIYGGTLAGTPITYAITLPQGTTIDLITMFLPDCGTHLWSGDFVDNPTANRVRIYVIPTEGEVIINITITFYCTSTRITGEGCCNIMPNAAPPEPTSESVRIAARGRCAAQQALPPGFVNCAPCRPETTNPQRRYTTIGERDRLLSEISRCGFYFLNSQTGGLCADTRADQNDMTRNQSIVDGAPLLETTRPYTIHQYRTISRLHGIEEIARPVRGPTAGEFTARRRTAIQTAAANAVRHGEHFRTLPPPPPCTPPNTLPQPGVPYRQQPTPCILGLRRVDYSNPIAK